MQEVALQAHDLGKLFFKDMRGGISDIELGLEFIPSAGRKKKQGQEGMQEEDVMEEGQTTSCSAMISEYASDECPDEEEDSHDGDRSDDDEIVEGLNELALVEEMDQNSP
jgi:hypothetical protein